MYSLLSLTQHDGAVENNREEDKDIVKTTNVADIQNATSIFRSIMYVCILRDCPSVGTELAQGTGCATL